MLKTISKKFYRLKTSRNYLKFIKLFHIIFGEKFNKKIPVPNIYDYSIHRKDIINQINLLFTSQVLLCRNIVPYMYEAERGTVVNVSSLATIYPVPYMSIYNAGKSAFSSFTQSLMLEYKEYIKIVDLRLGDVKTDFNLKQAKHEEIKWSSKMKKVWHQVEKQLNESPSPEIVAGQILKIISSQKSGVFYRGGFFQSKVAPIVRNFLNHKSLLFLLHHRYHN